MRLISILSFSLLIASTFTENCFGWTNPWGFFWNTCQCVLKPNFNGLRRSLDANLHGQHLVKDTVLNGLEAHYNNPNPQRAKVFMFSGAYGTGKNFVAEMIAEYLFPDANDRAKYVLKFSPNVFSTRTADQDIISIKEIIASMAYYDCERALIIFDEIDKIPRKILKSLTHFMGNENHDQGINYHKLTFILLANEAMSAIRKKTKDHHMAEKIRTHLTLTDFEHLIRAELSKQLGQQNDEMIRRGYISSYVPFMPLERDHVEKCINSYVKERKIANKFDAHDVKAVLQMISFDEDQTVSTQNKGENSGLYSTDGCRHVKEKVDFQYIKKTRHTEF